MPYRSALPPPSRPLLIHTRIQSTAVLGLGLTYLFSTPTFIHTLERHLSSLLPFLPSTLPVPASILTHPLVAQQQQLTSAILVGIGTVYALSIVYGLWEYVYLSVPARLVIAVAGLGSWILAPERVGVTLAVVLVNDGLGALVAGWVLRGGLRGLVFGGEEGKGKGKEREE